MSTTLFEYLGAFEAGERVEVMTKTLDASLEQKNWMRAEGQETIARAYLALGGVVRIAPKMKVVDMSVLIESKIDCDFSDDNSVRRFISRLTNISQSGKYADSSLGFRWTYCKPRMDHWHAWNGGKCPLPDGVLVSVRVASKQCRNEFHVPISAIECEWGDCGAIVAFKVVGIAKGWCWAHDNSSNEETP